MCFGFCRRKNRNKSQYSKSKGLSEDEIAKEAKRMLDEWQVEMYANNSYLHKIPSDRLDLKYQEFITQLRKNNKNRN